MMTFSARIRLILLTFSILFGQEVSSQINFKTIRTENFPDSLYSNFFESHIIAADHADIDGDGDIDLCVLNKQNGGIYLNNGSGAFTYNDTISNQINGIDRGDMRFFDADNDSDMDILIIGDDPTLFESFFIYTNDGSGNFTQNRLPGLNGGGDRRIQVGDINGDSLVDIVLNYANALSIYFNQDSLNFVASNQTITLNAFTEFKLVDYNNDQHLDLVIPFPVNSREMWFYTNDGGGDFSRDMNQFVDACRFFEYNLADLNADGYPELIVDNNYSSTGNRIRSPRIYMNNNGIFQPFDSTLFGNQASRISIVTEDVDQDNDIDIVNLMDGKVYLNNGPASFITQTDPSLADYSQFVFDQTTKKNFVFDVDQDNDQDVIHLQSNACPGCPWSFPDIRPGYVGYNNGTGVFDINYNKVLEYSDLYLITKFDNDNLPDFITAPQKVVLQGNNYAFDQSISFTPFSLNSVFEKEVAFNFVLDQREEIFMLRDLGSNQRGLRIFTPSVNNYFQYSVKALNLPPNSFTARDPLILDFNGDSLLDLISMSFRGQFNDTMIINSFERTAQGLESNYTDQFIIPIAQNANEYIYKLDYNGDGNEDFMVVYSSFIIPNVVERLYISNGDGTFTDTPHALTGAGAENFSLFKDLDQDGFTDAVGYNSVDTTFVIWMNNGTPSWQASDTIKISDRYYSNFDFADLNLDNKADLIVYENDGRNKGVLSVFEKNQLDKYELTTSYPLGSDAMWGRMELADMNADGLMDVVISGQNTLSGAKSIRIIENTSCNNSQNDTTRLDIVACERYVYNSFVYLQSIVDHHTYSNALGCDSVVELDITIVPADRVRDTVESCENTYTWRNNVTYTNSGFYTHTFANSQGCDSIVTLVLTLGGNTSYTDSIISCENTYSWIDGITYTQNTDTPSITFINRFGCDSTILLDLKFSDVNDSVYIQDRTAIAFDSSYHYQWLNCDENYRRIIGATDYKHTPLDSGWFAVEITADNCVDTSACVYIAPTSLKEIDLDQLIKLYPNPSESEIFINTASIPNQPYTIRVFALDGSLMDKRSNVSNTIFRYQHDLENGLYLIELNFENQSLRKMISVVN